MTTFGQIYKGRPSFHVLNAATYVPLNNIFQHHLDILDATVKMQEIIPRQRMKRDFKVLDHCLVFIRPHCLLQHSSY